MTGREELAPLLNCDMRAELDRLLRQIPPGRVTTYGALADALGDRVAARWVGEVLLDHAHDARCRCHRVVRHDGSPGLYISGNAAAKLRRLASEGVPIKQGRVLLNDPFVAFQTSAPLRRLKEFQNSVPKRLQLRRTIAAPQEVAALDVAYLSPLEAVVACTICDGSTLAALHSQTFRVPIRFPYISGYLSFRELPAMLTAWDAMNAQGHTADVVLIDGNGILHPRRAGIAACFGLLADVPTIGIGKSLLCGHVDLKDFPSGERRSVRDGDDRIGLAIKSTGTSRPIFVSPGNHVDLEQAADIVQQLFAGHRLPEPLHIADRMTKQQVRALRVAEHGGHSRTQSTEPAD